MLRFGNEQPSRKGSHMPKISGSGMAEFMEKMPGFWSSYKEMGYKMWTEGQLDAPLRELLRLKSAELAHCNH